MSSEDHSRFTNLNYEAFQRLARDESLSRFEKVGFPDSYRKKFETRIFRDILKKVPAFSKKQSILLDIGAGCSDLPRMLIRHAEELAQELILIDSPEMLDQLPDSNSARKYYGRFPVGFEKMLKEYSGRISGIVTYSVLQYVYVDSNPFEFIDAGLSLLAQGGYWLIGDIPNASMRKRFIDSDSGAAYHRRHFPKNPKPEIQWNRPEPGMIDDGVILGLLARIRAAGFHAWIVPQPSGLPLANRREDLLIARP